MNKDLIKKMISVGKNFYDREWLFATSGNLSISTEDGIILTASGAHKGYLTEDDFVLIDFEGNVIEGNGKPSGETDFHLQLFNSFKSVNSVIHTHSVYSSLISLNEKVEFKDNEIMKAFEDIKEPAEPMIIPVFPNLQQKAELIELIGNNSNVIKFGYLLKGHGLFAFASSLEKAQIYTEAFEFLFKFEYLKGQK